MEFVHTGLPARVVFGAGSRHRVPAEVRALGAARVVLIGRGTRADELAADLGDLLAGRIAEVVEHVPTGVAAAAVATVARLGADGVVCLGGGSSVGLAKIVARETGLPVLAVPTTYAGSEMTPVWGLTAAGRKTTGRDSRVLPRTVVYDPELTVSLPVAVSAASGMNALAHCVEGLYAPDASPVTSLLAAEGVRALAAALPAVVADPADLDARSTALYGAWLAGATLGATTMGVHHKVCHVLGGTFGLPHAATHSAVLPAAVAFVAPAAPAAMERLAAALRAGAAGPGPRPAGALAGLGGTAGVPGPGAGGRARGDSAAGLLFDLATRIGAPTDLAPLGLAAADLPLAADLVVAGAPAAPREVDVPGVTRLLLSALSGLRPDRDTQVDMTASTQMR